MTVKYLPDWFQSTTFKRTARKCRQTLTDLTERPYAFVKYQIARGTNDISFVSALLESQKLNDEEKFAAKWSAMSLYAAGVDTVRKAPVGDTLDAQSARPLRYLNAFSWR
jgi:hypothetical protein